MKQRVKVLLSMLVLLLLVNSIAVCASADITDAHDGNCAIMQGEYIIGDESVISENTDNKISIEKEESNTDNYTEKSDKEDNNENNNTENNNAEENNKENNNAEINNNEIQNDFSDSIKEVPVYESLGNSEESKESQKNTITENDNQENTDELNKDNSTKSNDMQNISQESEKADNALKAVESITVTKTTYNTISFKWQRAEGAKRYLIYRSTKADRGFKRIANITKLNYVDKKNIVTGRTYYYKIITYNNGKRGEAKIFSAQTSPEKVTDLKAYINQKSQIELTWKKAKGAKSYAIYRSENKSSGYKKIKEVKRCKYTDTNAKKNITYYYKVVAINGKARGKAVRCSATIADALNYEEMKAVWISYLDFAMLKDKNEKTFRKNVGKMYDEITDNGLNTVIVHVRSHSNAIYPSKYYPWAGYITSQNNGPSYDPLKIMIEEAHKRKLSFHAWINPYRLANSGVANPASNGNINKIVNGVAEIVSNYQVDGIHFDDYFYPSSDRTEQSEKMKNVNKMIKKVYKKIKSINNTVVFGISPSGQMSYAKSIGCDVESWLSDDGYVDYLMPQLYWSDEYETASGAVINMFSQRMNEWMDINENDIPLYAGLALYKVGNTVKNAWGNDYGWGNSDDNLYRQYNKAKDNGYMGYSLYRFEWLTKEIAQDELEQLNEMN